MALNFNKSYRKAFFNYYYFSHINLEIQIKPGQKQEVIQGHWEFLEQPKIGVGKHPEGH